MEPTSLIYRRALVVLSGGQDSTTCLFMAKRTMAREVHAITFDYGQRHSLEVQAAHIVARMAEVESHEVLAVGPVLKGTSPLVSGRSVEHYQDAAHLPGGIEKTFVPMRNALFLVLAINRAVVLGCDAVVTGVSQEDYGGYPDCRRPFIDSMRNMAKQALGESVKEDISIVTPLMYLDKAATVALALGLPGCMEAMAYTHTCYEGLFPPCGTCHACLLRSAGFNKAKVADPMMVRALS